MKPLMSDSNIPKLQVGFLPFIPKPVTEHATVYTAMINFVKILKQLDQNKNQCQNSVMRVYTVLWWIFTLNVIEIQSTRTMSGWFLYDEILGKLYW